MAKAPVAGFAKTRLVPALGEQGAALLAQRLLCHALAQAADAGARSITLWVTPDAAHPAFVDAQRQHGVAIETQYHGDLGARMARVFETGFEADPRPLLLMGTDAPALDAALLRRAAATLANHDAVFVPALDGGYTLVGLRAAPPALLQALFADLRWSTPEVMQQTRDRLRASGYRHAELPAVADIDEPADLVHLPPGFN
ncbi:MAG: TIGR04282 family arsenosugar biosynthesis glycosyltransferase [Pseudomonadota bacterium]|nr:TIGR04282 family arsenosugar biosynthesis glycosyltransferase [Pseudomonadota bacterium]